MQDQLFKQEFIKQPNVSRVAGFYGTQRTVELERPTTLTALANPYSLISERQKQLMQTYAKIYGKLPTQKILISPETFPQAYQEVMNRSSPNSIYQDYRQLAEALFNGGAFQRFPAANNVVAVAPVAINVQQQVQQVRQIMADGGPVAPIQIPPQNAQVNQALIMNGFVQSPIQQLSQTFNKMSMGQQSMSSKSSLSQSSSDATSMLQKGQQSSMEESKKTILSYKTNSQSIDDLIDPKSANISHLRKDTSSQQVSFEIPEDAQLFLNSIREIKESLRQDLILLEATLQPMGVKRNDLIMKIRSKSYSTQQDHDDMVKEIKELEMAEGAKRTTYDKVLNAYISRGHQEQLIIDKGKGPSADLMRQSAPASMNSEVFAHMSQPIQDIHQKAQESMMASQRSSLSQQSKVTSQADPLPDGDISAAFNPVDTSEISMTNAMSQVQNANSFSGTQLQTTPDMITPNPPGGISQMRSQTLDTLMDAQSQQATSNAPPTRLPQSTPGLDIDMEDIPDALIAKHGSGMNDTQMTDLMGGKLSDPMLQAMFDIPKSNASTASVRSQKMDLNYSPSMQSSVTQNLLPTIAQQSMKSGTLGGTSQTSKLTDKGRYLGSLYIGNSSQGGGTEMTQLAAASQHLFKKPQNSMGGSQNTQLTIPGMTLEGLMNISRGSKK